MNSEKLWRLGFVWHPKRSIVIAPEPATIQTAMQGMEQTLSFRQSRLVWKPKFWLISRSKLLSRSARKVLSQLPAPHLASLGWIWRPKQPIDTNVAVLSAPVLSPVVEEEEQPLKDIRFPESNFSSSSPCRATDVSDAIADQKPDFALSRIAAAELRVPKKAEVYMPELIDDIVTYTGLGKENGIHYHVKFLGYQSLENDTCFYRRCEFPDIKTLAILLAEGLKKGKIKWSQVKDNQVKKRVRELLPSNFFN
jgi:hypothetical protein